MSPGNSGRKAGQSQQVQHGLVLGHMAPLDQRCPASQGSLPHPPYPASPWRLPEPGQSQVANPSSFPAPTPGSMHGFFSSILLKHLFQASGDTLSLPSRI